MVSSLRYPPGIPIARVVTDVVTLALVDCRIREIKQNGVWGERHRSVGVAWRYEEDRRPFCGNHVSVHGKVFGRLIPVIDLHSSHQSRALNHRNRFSFASVSVPRTNEPRTVVGYGVETANTSQVRVICKADLTSIIDRKRALDKPELIHAESTIIG